MRGLQGRCLDGLKTGIEMLLPPAVSVFLSQYRAEPHSLLRRGDAGIKTRFSAFVEQLKADKQGKAQAGQKTNQEQGGGISR